MPEFPVWQRYPVNPRRTRSRPLPPGSTPSLELRVAHHADRLDLGAEAGTADTISYWANATPADQTGREAPA